MSTIDNNNEETESFYLRIKKLAESLLLHFHDKLERMLGII